MDKKIAVILIILTAGLISAQSIDITKPSGASSWYQGTRYDIKWTTRGSLSSFVKIRLFNAAGTVRVLGITDRTENDGLFRWRIPASVTPGSYIIRIKTTDNRYSDDSPVFRIEESLSSAAGFVARHEPRFTNDIEVSSIFTDRCKVWVKFTNKGGSRIDHVFREKTWVNGRLLHNEMHHIILQPRGSMAHEILSVRANLLFSTKIKVEIDSDNTLLESDELNNILEKRVKCNLWIKDK